MLYLTIILEVIKQTISQIKIERCCEFLTHQTVLIILLVIKQTNSQIQIERCFEFLTHQTVLIILVVIKQTTFRLRDVVNFEPTRQSWSASQEFPSEPSRARGWNPPLRAERNQTQGNLPPRDNNIFLAPEFLLEIINTCLKFGAPSTCSAFSSSAWIPSKWST